MTKTIRNFKILRANIRMKKTQTITRRRKNIKIMMNMREWKKKKKETTFKN